MRCLFNKWASWRHKGFPASKKATLLRKRRAALEGLGICDSGGVDRRERPRHSGIPCENMCRTAATTSDYFQGLGLILAAGRGPGLSHAHAPRKHSL